MGPARGRRRTAPAAGLSLARLVAPLAASDWLARRGAAWLRRQRRRHRPYAAPLPEEVRRRLEPWFGPATLAEVRLRRVDRLDPPRLLRALVRLRLVPADLGRLLGITYLDTIVVPRPRDSGPEEGLASLFHECVHVLQARRLGADEFARRYLSGWARAGCRYGAIPLERDAYALAARFAAQPERPFDVEAEIDRRLAASILSGPDLQ